MSAVNNQWPPLITASVDNIPGQATGVTTSDPYHATGISWASVSPGPIPPSVWAEQRSYYYRNLYQRQACWQRNQTGAFVGAVFGGIVIGLIIASWIALFVAWRRAKARAIRATRDLEQRVGRESFNSVDFYTPDADRNEDKLPLLLQDGAERRSADSIDGGPR